MTGTGTLSAIACVSGRSKPCLRAVAVHRGQQDFAGAERDHFLGVFDGVDPGRVAPAMGEDLPALAAAGALDPLGVDRDHDALLAEFFGRLLDEFAVGDRGAS